MLKCIIIEDDFAFALDTQIKAEEIGLEVIHVISNYDDIIPILNKSDADIILSDVKLGSNQYAYDALSQISNLPPIIFFSSFVDDHLYQQSKLIEPYIYLIKPFDRLTLQSSIDGALRSKKKSKQKGVDIHRDENLVFIRSKGKLISIDSRKVIYVHSEGNYCYINSNDKKSAIRSSLKNVIEKFMNPNFIQIHRAYLINTNYVTKILVGENIVEMNDLTLPIGRKYKKALIDKLKQ